MNCPEVELPEIIVPQTACADEGRRHTFSICTRKPNNETPSRQIRSDPWTIARKNGANRAIRVGPHSVAPTVFFFLKDRPAPILNAHQTCSYALMQSASNRQLSTEIFGTVSVVTIITKGLSR